MSYEILLKKIRLSGKKYITDKELNENIKELNLEYNKVINNLITNRYLIRIFRGIFYITTLEEKKYKKVDVSFNEIITNALKIKKIDNWYFGLDSAIKLNRVIFETCFVDYIINDKIFRAKPITIMNRRIKFIKIKKDLLTFGIIKNKGLRYSNLEKTVLDIIYILKYNNATNKEILNKIIDLIDKCDTKKLKKYSVYYPKTIINVIEEYI
jgi:predicted transcriptional regulator of viral defense system